MVGWTRRYRDRPLFVGTIHLVGVFEMPKTRTRKPILNGRVSAKLGPKAMKACRIAAKRAAPKCDGVVTKLAAYIIAATCRNTKPKTEDIGTYSHGMVPHNSTFGPSFMSRFSMDYYVKASPKTHNGNNDLDRLMLEMEALGIIKRSGWSCRWAGLKTEGARVILDQEKIKSEINTIAALFEDKDEDEDDVFSKADEAKAAKVKAAKKRKAKAAKTLADAKAQAEDDEDDDDPADEDEYNEDDDEDEDDDE